MTPATLVRRRGRPALVEGERSVEPRFSLPESDLHALTAIADAERVSLASICRRAIAHFLGLRVRQQARLSRRIVLTRGRIGL